MRMLKTCCRVVLSAGLMTAAGCSKDSGSGEMQPGASQGNEAPPATGTVPMNKLSDGQILSIVGRVDTAEIDQAQVALDKTNDPDIRTFATHMVDEHTAAKQAGAQLATQASLTRAPSPKALELESKATQTLAMLKAADSASFDPTYVRAQVDQHAEVLKLIDDQLLPAVMAPALRDYLTNARAMVQRHLEQARQLQK